MKKQLIQIVAVAGALLAAQQAHAATFGVTTSDGLVINHTSSYDTPPYDFTDGVYKNSNFQPQPGDVNMLTLDTATLNSILTTQLGALGAGESYQINSASFSAGSAAQDYQVGVITVHAMTTAFNVDQASYDHADKSTSTTWASGSLSSADYNASVITTGSNDTAVSAVFSGLGSTLQDWVDGGDNLGLAFVASSSAGGAAAWTTVSTVGLTIDAEIVTPSVTWDGGASGLWDTAANWDADVVPASGDTVNINNAAVSLTYGAVYSPGVVNLAGTASLDVSGGNVARFQSSTTFNVGSQANFGASDDFFDLQGVTLNFDSGATADLGTWEFKTSATVQFNLDAAGFTTIDTGRMKPEMALNNFTWVVDMANYTGVAQTITLMDFATNNGNLVDMSAAGFQTGTLTILNSGAFDNCSLAWNESTLAVELTVESIVITAPPGLELLVDNFDSNTLETSDFVQNDLGDGKWHHAGAWSVSDGELMAAGDTDVATESEGALLRAVAVGAATGKRLTLTFDYTLAAAGESLSVFLYGTKIEAGFNTDGTGRMANHGHVAYGGSGRFQYLEGEQDNTLVSSVEFVGGLTVSESAPTSYFGDPSAGGAQYAYFGKITGGTSGTFSQTVDLGQWGLSVTDFDYINVGFARDAVAGSEVTIDNVSLVVNYITWDNDSGDGLWTTAANWNPDGVPGASGRVLVETGTVTSAQNDFSELYISEGASVTFAEDLQTGNLISTAGTLDKSGVWRLSGASVTLESTGVLGANITHFDTLNSTFNVEDGASFANSSMPFEHKGANTFGYTLSETGFTTLVAGGLLSGSSAQWSDATYNIDVSAYDISRGTTIVLADYASHAAAFDGPFNPTVNIITGTGTQELGGSLAFDTTESQLVLTITDFVNDAPVARNLSFSVPDGDQVSFTLPASDPDGQALSYEIVGGPANGTLSGTAPDLTYIAPGGWAGSDEITFTASDGSLTSNTGTVSVASMPQTAAAVWSLYDDAIRNDPLNVEWLTSWTNGNIVVSQIRYDLGTMVGTRTNASPKMAAFYAYPIGGTDLPGIVQIHGGGQKGSAELAQYWAEQGYAAISINWGAGDLLAGVPNTDWDGLPAGHYYPGTDFQNWTDPHATETHASLYDVAHPLNSSWMLNSYAARRALTFLQNEPHVDGSKLGVTGHSMGGTTTVITSTDPRITCVTPSVGGPGFRYEDWWGVPGSGRSTGTAYLQDYNQTVAAEVYWPDITCPTLFLEASNDFNAPFDPIVQSMALQLTENPDVPQQLAFSPHKNHIFDTDAYAARVLWQKAHLTDGFDFPERAVAQLTQEDGVPVFRVWPDESTSNTVVSVDIYYGIDRQVLSRFYRDAQAVKIDGQNYWEALCPVYDLDEMMVVLAVVTYDCGFDLAMPNGYASPTRTFSVASEVSLVYPPELASSGVVATAEKVRLIDDFSRGYHDWYWRWAGLSNWQLTTRKVTDPSWQGPAGADLALDVVTTTAGNTLGITLNTMAWNATSANTYTASVALPVAGTNSISVSLSDFTNGQGVPLTTWDNATWLQFSSASGYPTWTGSMPEFDNLRWVGGVYTFINGVTSTWLEQYGLPLNDRAVLGDSDGDGLSAWEEEFAGTNPTNSASVLRVEGVVPVTNGVQFSWQAVSGKSYTVWFKANLTDALWTEEATGVAGVEPFSSHTVVSDSPTGFVLIEVE